MTLIKIYMQLTKQFQSRLSRLYIEDEQNMEVLRPTYLYEKIPYLYHTSVCILVRIHC